MSAATPIERIAAAQARFAPAGGPAWSRRRSRALDVLAARGLPDRRDENWKYLDHARIAEHAFEVAPRAPGRRRRARVPDPRDPGGAARGPRGRPIPARAVRGHVAAGTRGRRPRCAHRARSRGGACAPAHARRRRRRPLCAARRGPGRRRRRPARRRGLRPRRSGACRARRDGGDACRAPGPHGRPGGQPLALHDRRAVRRARRGGRRSATWQPRSRSANTRN